MSMKKKRAKIDLPVKKIWCCQIDKTFDKQGPAFQLLQPALFQKTLDIVHLKDLQKHDTFAETVFVKLGALQKTDFYYGTGLILGN